MEHGVHAAGRTPAKSASLKRKDAPQVRPEISENAMRVLEKRYLRKNEEGVPVETVEDMFLRVSENIAEADELYDPKADTRATAIEFYRLMTSLEFMPNSPTLMNAGRELQQLSACFVLPVEDSMESIFEAIKNTALIHKSGGGTGFSFSKLRPSGDTVGSTSGISSGPISFMTVFDSATEAIKQGGTRRGANMGILRVDHPDIMNFITCKEDNAKLNNFNISVNITEDFMDAVEAGTDYTLTSPRTSAPASTLKASMVFDKIVDMAWKNGDPGIIFIDRINAENPTPALGDIESTNPCGEQPLMPYESCNLGSINLSRMLAKLGNSYAIDFKKLESTVTKAVHFLDNVIDMNHYPLEKIDEVTKSNRKIGLGVMGFADMLIRLGIAYDSEEGIQTAEEVMGFIQKAGYAASSALAAKRGDFPNYKGSRHESEGRRPRNATVTTIAPTGTISIISSCSSGVEPLFALAFTRNVMDGAELLEVNPLFGEIARERGFDDPEIMKRVAATGTLHGVEGIPADVKRLFVTAHDITPIWHIRMQAAFQKYTDNAVSKTVNFGNEATREDVAEVYKLAHKLGCKGVTVYRDGSRENQVLSMGNEKEKAAAKPDPGAQAAATPKKRGEVAFGVTKKMKTGCGNLYVTINEDEEGRPFEIFTQIGKAGGCVSSQCEAMGRMTSLALRSGVEAQEIVNQMRGISCHLPVGLGAVKVSSCSDAMAKAMEWYLGLKRSIESSLGSSAISPQAQGAEVRAKEDMRSVLGVQRNTVIEASKVSMQLTTYPAEVFRRGACPDCGGTVEHADGCVVCIGCGYTECG